MEDIDKLMGDLAIAKAEHNKVYEAAYELEQELHVAADKVAELRVKLNKLIEQRVNERAEALET